MIVYQHDAFLMQLKNVPAPGCEGIRASGFIALRNLNSGT